MHACLNFDGRAKYHIFYRRLILSRYIRPVAETLFPESVGPGAYLLGFGWVEVLDLVWLGWIGGRLQARGCLMMDGYAGGSRPGLVSMDRQEASGPSSRRDGRL